jgi:flagellar basal-body rod protein FlgB
MSDISLMALATRKMDWLAERQAVVAQNIANADTPAYRARDLSAFNQALSGAALKLAATDPRHIGLAESAGNHAEIVEIAGDRTFNGNNVSLERELAKLGETNGQYALSVNLVKSFHRLAMMSLKG